ncbi:TetR/AcrR family transcriptional regulator [Desertibaculum subflavum]|uniref:TetR/AcrR family transcriptional regulator n=1 Tax=Desertibaculum subflavum TaxID=2268458 RepID=UPI0034D2D382
MAIKLFVAKGYSGTRLDEVARAARVSKGLPYLYFESKEDLFKAVVREALLPPLIAGEARLQVHQGPVAELLRGLVRDYADYVRHVSGGIAKLVIAEANNFPEIARFYVEEVVARGRAFMADLIRRGIANGEFRTVDPVGYAGVIGAPLTMLAIWQHSLAPFDPTADPARFLDAYVDLVIAGLRR